MDPVYPSEMLLPTSRILVQENVVTYNISMNFDHHEIFQSYAPVQTCPIRNESCIYNIESMEESSIYASPRT
jgi:hypothetical protein